MSSALPRRLVVVFAILLHVAVTAPVRASVAEAPVDHKKFVRDAVNRFLGPVSSLDIVRVLGKLDALKLPATLTGPPTAASPSANPALAHSVASFLSAIGHEMSVAAPTAAHENKGEGDADASRAAASFLSAIKRETLSPAAAHENPKEEGDVVAASGSRRAGTAGIIVSAFVAAALGNFFF